MNNEITVSVAGCTAVGTSAVCQLIAETLEQHNFDVTLNFVYNEHERRDDDLQSEIIEYIHNRVTIDVNEVKRIRQECVKK